MDAYVYAACADNVLAGRLDGIGNYARLREPIHKTVVGRMDYLTSLARGRPNWVGLIRHYLFPTMVEFGPVTSPDAEFSDGSRPSCRNLIRKSSLADTSRVPPHNVTGTGAGGRLRCRSVSIVAGEVFLLEVVGERKLMRVQMECKDGRWIAVFASGRGQRRAELRDGLRAGFFDQRERYARELK